jgi:DNA-binding LacI/PurR family transcriptional regulator/DNA-binding transcriptional regulator YhcF (GntR family)
VTSDDLKELSALPLKSRLAERVREVVRSEILHGRWKTQLPPERHLAQELQVSRPTLHMALRALEREGLVRRHERLPWEVVKRFSPRPHALKRRAEVMLLHYSRFRSDLTDVLAVTDQLRQRLYRMGYELKMRDPFARGTRNLDKLLSRFDAEHRPAFYVLLSVPPEVHRWFDAKKIPAMISGSREAAVKLPAIDMANQVMMQHAVQYLLRRGHRRLAFFNVIGLAGGALIQNQSFLKACKEWHTGDVQGVITTCAVRPAAVADTVRRTFGQGNAPTAVITTNPEFVIAIYTKLAAMGLRIPRDVSVVVLGHWPFLDFLNPITTCYRVSWEHWANRIARIIENHLRLGALPTHFWKVLPTLREGQSVREMSRQS